MDLAKLYSGRFSQDELRAKNAIWNILTQRFFQKWVTPSDTIVDIGAGYCEFINNIQCAKKIAVDINPDIKEFAHPDITIIPQKSTEMDGIKDHSAHIVFMSNFLEHLRSKEEVLQTFKEVKRILAPQGKLIILQPNIRFLSKQYWDFFDHHTALSDKSLCEGLLLSGFSILKNYPKFLPYTTKSRFPKSPLFIHLYLSFPILWKIFGKQCCVIATPAVSTKTCRVS